VEDADDLRAAGAGKLEDDVATHGKLRSGNNEGRARPIFAVRARVRSSRSMRSRTASERSGLSPAMYASISARSDEA